jgi:hypothetical protein
MSPHISYLTVCMVYYRVPSALTYELRLSNKDNVSDEICKGGRRLLCKHQRKDRGSEDETSYLSRKSEQYQQEAISKHLPKISQVVEGTGVRLQRDHDQ